MVNSETIAALYGYCQSSGHSSTVPEQEYPIMVRSEKRLNDCSRTFFALDQAFLVVLLDPTVAIPGERNGLLMSRIVSQKPARILDFQIRGVPEFPNVALA